MQHPCALPMCLSWVPLITWVLASCCTLYENEIFTLQANFRELLSSSKFDPDVGQISKSQNITIEKVIVTNIMYAKYECSCYKCMHTCQVGKVQKREISLFASYQRGRFCANPFHDINFLHQHSNSGWNFENDEIFPPYNCLKLIIWCRTFYYYALWILCWLSNAFSLKNSIQCTLLKEKMIGRKWGSKRGRFPLLGGRWMFRREMGSKRGSLPPKEGDLTCLCM